MIRDSTLVHEAATLGIAVTKTGLRGGNIVFSLTAGEHKFQAIGRRAARDFLRAVAFGDDSATSRAVARHFHASLSHHIAPILGEDDD